MWTWNKKLNSWDSGVVVVFSGGLGDSSDPGRGGDSGGLGGISPPPPPSVPAAKRRTNSRSIIAQRNLVAFCKPMKLNSWGPTTAKEMWAWNKRLIEDLCESVGREARLLQSTKGGLLVTTSYSGMRTPENAIVAMHPLLPGCDIDQVKFLCSCDNGKVPTHISLIGKLLPPEHHFSDLDDRLPADMNDFLDSMEKEFPVAPPNCQHKDAIPLLQQRAEGYRAMGKYLMSMHARVFKTKFSSPCIRHHKGDYEVNYYDEQYHDMLGNGMDPISMEICGAVCVGASPLGLQHGLAHSSMRALHTWCATMRGTTPDVIIWECAANAVYMQTVKWWLEDKYSVVFIQHPGPRGLGHPMYRPRTYGILINKARFRFMGSEEEYFKVFGANCSLDGSAFFIAGESRQLKELRRLAEVRGFLPPADPNGYDWLQLCADGMKKRAVEHEQLREKYTSKVSETYICDLEQRPTAGSHGGEDFNSLVTHGFIYDFGTKRALVAEEHLCAQMMPVLSEAKEMRDYPCIFGNLVDEGMLTCNEMKKLAGNAMHCPTVGSVIYYALASIVDIRPKLTASLSNAAASFVSQALEDNEDDIEADGAQLCFF